MLFSIICLSRKFSVSCKRLFETRYFSATDWKQTVAFSLPTILYKNVTTRWIRSLHHFNPTPFRVRRFFASAGGGKVSPQGRKFVRDLRITGAGRIERATRRGKTGGTEAAARTGSGNRESPEQRRGNGPAADSGPAVRGTSGIFRRDAVLN